MTRSRASAAGYRNRRAATPPCRAAASPDPRVEEAPHLPHGRAGHPPVNLVPARRERFRGVPQSLSSPSIRSAAWKRPSTLAPPSQTLASRASKGSLVIATSLTPASPKTRPRCAAGSCARKNSRASRQVGRGRVEAERVEYGDDAARRLRHRRVLHEERPPHEVGLRRLSSARTPRNSRARSGRSRRRGSDTSEARRCPTGSVRRTPARRGACACRRPARPRRPPTPASAALPRLEGASSQSRCSSSIFPRGF